MMQGIDHVNLVVRDLGTMVRFYESALGLTVTKRVTISGDWIDRVVGLSGVTADVVYLDAPVGPRVELIAYRNPVGTSPDKSGQPNTLGLRHLAFRVDDIDSMVQQLRDAGVTTMGDVQQVPDQQVKYADGVRKRLVYFHDPEGNLLELCAYQGHA